MAVLLTNGKYYIAHSRTGAVVKVPDIGRAQDFHTVERAVAQKEKAPGKCASYFYIDTDKVEAEPIAEAGPVKKEKKPKAKRKNFSKEERLQVYRKTEGHCYLCGEFVGFNSFEIEHRIPISNGGTNDLSNLFPSCHCCNKIKHDIYPADFMERVTQIFMHQMDKKYGANPDWKTAHGLLVKLV